MAVILVTNDCSIEVPREVLQKHSFYFNSAFSSGLGESEDGRFSFPDMTAANLKLFKKFVENGFNSWPESASPENDSHAVCQASTRTAVEEVFKMAGLSDYWQIPDLESLCLTRMATIMESLLTSDILRGHTTHENCVFRDFLFLWVRSCQSYPPEFNNYLYGLITKHAVRLLDPAPFSGIDLHRDKPVIELVISVLSSDCLCVSSEDEVLKVAIRWVEALSRNEEDSLHLSAVEQLLDCVRPGLLFYPSQRRLINLWSSRFPSYKWHKCMDNKTFTSHIRETPASGAFYSIFRSIPFPHDFFRSRASTPCLLSLLPNTHGNGLSLRFFNLKTAEVRIQKIPEDVLNQLSNNSTDVGDLDNRIYMCHPTLSSGGRVIVVLCFDIINGQLNGFVWCLSTHQAQWLPPVPVPPDNRNTGYYLRAYRLGLATMTDGLYVYSTTSIAQHVNLHVFRFDFISWSWCNFHSVTILSETNSSTVLFTPIEHVNLIANDGWLYANVELVDRASAARMQSIGRQNLHDASNVRSFLYRFRPRKHSNSGVELEVLPSAPFLVRIYRLLALEDCRPTQTKRARFLFAVGTCTRDDRANRYCFEINARRWVRWCPTENASLERPRSRVLTSLTPEFLGFRGLVCVSTLNEADLEELTKTDQSSTSDGSDEASTPALNINPILVLAGRPDYGYMDYMNIPCGLWIYRPFLTSDRRSPPVSTFPENRPTRPLPSEIGSPSQETPFCPLLVYMNWDNFTTGTCDLFNFINSAPSTRPRHRHVSPPDRNRLSSADSD